MDTIVEFNYLHSLMQKWPLLPLNISVREGQEIEFDLILTVLNGGLVAVLLVVCRFLAVRTLISIHLLSRLQGSFYC